MNIMMLLEMASDAFGDRTAVTSPIDGIAMTYAELFAAAGGAASLIRESGRSRFAMLDVSSPAIPVALFGSAWAGVPYAPLNYRLTADEVSGLLTRLESVKLVTEHDRVTDYRDDPAISVRSREDFLNAAIASDPLADYWSMEPEDTAVLLFTSGTTGAPKAAVLRQKHLTAYILGSVEFGGAEETDAALVCVPPYHIAGIAAVLSSVYAGRRIVQLPAFTAETWIELARNEKVTNAFVVPTMLARIVETLEGETTANMPHLRAISYGGGKMPLTIIRKAMDLFPDTDFTNAYGLTETSSTVAVLGPDEHRAAAASSDPVVQRRLVSVGQALPGIEIEIRGEEGEVLAAGERGEIYVRGEQVSGEYEGRGSVTDKEGWFPTRDAGSMDNEGFLFLEGRADDVIVRGGENMSPGEIEDVLLEHEAVADAAVVGVPDEQWGEGVAAALVVKTGFSGDADLSATLQAFVKDQLRSSRVPQRIEFWPELPYNETGKLLRRVVREKLGGS